MQSRRNTLISAAALSIAALGPVRGHAQEKRFSGVTLRVLGTQQPWDVEIQKRASQFEAATGAKVEFDLYTIVQTAQKVGVELATSSPVYDLVFLELSDVERFAQQADRLVALDDYVKAAPNFDLADVIPAFVKGGTVDGKLYVIPHFAATQILYYRGDLLKAAGFDGPPKTFDEFIAMCAKLQTPDRPCTALRGKPDSSENMWYWTQIFYGYGGRFVKDYPRDMTPTINTPEAVRAADVYKTLLTQYGIAGGASAGYDEVVVAMQQGNIAMAIEGAPLAGRILDPSMSKVVGKLGFTVPPAGPKGTFAPFNGHSYAINAASRHKDAAAAFILWEMSKEVMRDVAVNSTFLGVTRTSVWNDPDFRKVHGYDFGFGRFTDAYANTLAVADKDYAQGFRDGRQMRDRVGIALQETVVGRKTTQQALDDAQKDIVAMFRRDGVLQ